MTRVNWAFVGQFNTNDFAGPKNYNQPYNFIMIQVKINLFLYITKKSKLKNKINKEIQYHERANSIHICLLPKAIVI